MANSIKSDNLKYYLQNIGSTLIEFRQDEIDLEDKSTTSSIITQGYLLIYKPHRFYLSYNNPHPLLIVGSENFVNLYDYQMKHLTRINPKENIFNFLLLEQADFDNKFSILSEETKSNLYIVIIYLKELDRQVQLSFNRIDKTLQSIKTYEDNKIISVNVEKIRPIIRAQSNLFKIRNPDVYGPPTRRSVEDIYKLVTFK